MFFVVLFWFGRQVFGGLVVEEAKDGCADEADDGKRDSAEEERVHEAGGQAVGSAGNDAGEEEHHQCLKKSKLLKNYNGSTGYTNRNDNFSHPLGPLLINFEHTIAGAG